MALLEMVIGAVVEMGVQSPIEKAWDKVRHRREAVIRILKKVNLDADAPPDEFDAIYAYTLVEWGLYKEEATLNFERQDKGEDDNETSKRRICRFSETTACGSQYTQTLSE